MTQPQGSDWQDILQRSAPALLGDVTKVRESLLTDGALSLKVKTPMTMVCDALLAHPDGVSAIAGRARALGASEEEIAEAVGIAFLMGGMPGLVTGTSAFES